MMELFQFVMAIDPANDGTPSICDGYSPQKWWTLSIFDDHSPPEMMELFQFVMAIDPVNDGTPSICDGYSPQ